jgi:hypothetical protein
MATGRLPNEDTGRDQGDSQKPLARRGLLRAATGALAATAGAVALLSRPKQALASAFLTTSADAEATYEIDNTGTGSGVWGRSTSLGSSPTSPFSITGVTGTAGNGGNGVVGESIGGAGLNASSGVWGVSDVGVGVRAETNGASGAGLYATNFAGSGGGIGVLGQALGGASSMGVAGKNSVGGTGVYGESNSAIGVWGVTTTSGQGLANPAVAGSNLGGGAGLVGFTAGPSSIGLGGATNAGVGVYGSSTTGAGVAGYTSSGVAVGGTATGGGFAGYFSGPVFVNGSLTVTGGAKSAAVRSNGSLKRVYSLESPESWFEDFGSGQLSAGQATVSLESGFAGIVHTDAYRVFLTPRGESKGWLFINKQSPSGFTVQEAAGGTSNIAFDYRVVAKRADIAGARLEEVTEPPSYYQPPEPALDQAPKPPSSQASTPVPMPGAGGSSPGH